MAETIDRSAGPRGIMAASGTARTLRDRRHHGEVSGLQLSALTPSHVGFRTSTSRRLTLGDFMPNPRRRCRGRKSTQIPVVRSQGSVDIEDAQATRRGVSLSLGTFGFTFRVRPVFDIHIGALTLNDVSAAAAIERLRLEGLSAPVTIRGVMLGELQLEQLCRIRSSRVYRFLKVISSEPSTEV